MGQDVDGARFEGRHGVLREGRALRPALQDLGYHLVGYGCTTCIGNSGPLPEDVSAAVNEHDLAVTSVLSGNRT